MVTRTNTFRLGTEVTQRLAAWALLLDSDQTKIMREAFALWEANRPDEERRKVDTIVNELQ